MRIRRRCVLEIIFAVLVIAGAAFFVLYLKGGDREKGVRAADKISLEIRDSNNGKVYGRWPLGDKKEFSIEFIHSVHQSPVRETFTVDNVSEGATGSYLIRPLAVRFSSFGAGMQSDVEEGQTITRDGDALVISGFKKQFKELNLIVGTVSDHLLFIGDGVYSLRELCGKNAHITIRVKR